MAYKTILVHVDESGNNDACIDFAAQLALMHDAHLIGAAPTGVSRFFYESAAAGDVGAVVDDYLDTLRAAAEQRLAHFDALARRAGVNSFEARRTDDEDTGSLSMQARYCDLVVVGQYDPDGKLPSVYADLPEYVAMNGGVPVLVLPYVELSVPATPERILVAWNASPEANKAVRNALPLLQRARIVEVVVYIEDRQREAHGEQPGADIALFLARHGVKADVKQERNDNDIGEALLSLTTSLESDLLVMGCYGHSRFREITLGGASRTILRSMTLPVLMSH